jgi:ADP-ribosylglycohydrolase
MNNKTSIGQQFEACITGGAIGDAWGSGYENLTVANNANTFYLNKPKEPERIWAFTDDTQLTMATCEVLCTADDFQPEHLAAAFVRYYKEKRLTGLGASTLKAIIELEAGAHWSQVGRSGEFAAGNGAAMRIAPFAFFKKISRENIRDACRITHRNEEAYAGALAIWLSITMIISGAWTGDNNLFDLLIPELPDTRVRDRLIEIDAIKHKADIPSIARLGNNGYAVNSVPFAIFAATQTVKIGMLEMYRCIIESGGDTDTNAAMAGQIAGALTGVNGFPAGLITQLQAVDNYDRMRSIIEKTTKYIG